MITNLKMVEPAKPFACTMPDCGMSFTNEDHLHVHTKKHDMVLQLGLEQKAAFVADQTPTPTRFIRNCEEVGLFQDLQNDNPFEEGFKRAMESAKHGLLCMEHTPTSTSTDDLHTPQMMFPLADHGDSALYTSNNQRNITISRSSSDESGAIKEYETTTISKLTNEVTTISRRVEKHDDKIHTDETNKQGDRNKDILNETSVSYTNNVIKIRKDNLVNLECSKHNLITYADSVINDVNIIENERLQVPPIMSQKSYDFVVDNLTSDICKEIDNDKTNKDKNIDSNEEYTVTITIPGGKQIKMKSVDETPPVTKNTVLQNDTKEKLKNVIAKKLTPAVPVIQTLPPGTFIPVTIINPNHLPNKIPIVPLAPIVKNKVVKTRARRRKRHINLDSVIVSEKDDDCVIVDDNPSQNGAKKKLTRDDMNARVAASRRYRVRLKETMQQQVCEMTKLKQINEKLNLENAALKVLITHHMKKCPLADDLRITQENLMKGAT